MNASVRHPLSIEPLPSPLSSRAADLPAASQEWNERVDIEPLPTHERFCFVSGHDFSRAETPALPTPGNETDGKFVVDYSGASGTEVVQSLVHVSPIISWTWNP